MSILVKVESNMEEAYHFLRNLGLSPYEIEAYKALLSVGYSTPAELVSLCNVPRSRVYDVLRTLTRKGFASVRAGKPSVYVAVSPDVALKHRAKILKGESYKKMEDMDKSMDRAIPVLTELSHSTVTEELGPEDIARVYYNGDQFRNLLTDLLRESTKSVRLFTSQAGLRTDKPDDHGRIEAIFEVLRRGIDFKAIHSLSENTELDLYWEFERKGAKIRVPRIDLKETFWIIDENTLAMFVEGRNGKFDYGLVIRNKFMSTLFLRFFDERWKGAIPAGDIIQRLLRAKQEERAQALREFLASH